MSYDMYLRETFNWHMLRNFTEEHVPNPKCLKQITTGNI